MAALMAIGVGGVHIFHHPFASDPTCLATGV
jgi:hypothetical protein